MITRSSGWDEHAQRNYAVESLNGYIVLVEENCAGVITLSDWEDQLHLTWLAVLPQYQGQGLGTELIKYAQSQARLSNKPLTLQVLGANSAKSLYERLGFWVYDHNGPEKLLMRWQPNKSFF